MKPSDNPSFLRSVIYEMALDAYENKIVDTEMTDLIGETKEEWIQDYINVYLDRITEFPKKEENPRTRAISNRMYGIPLGYDVEISPTVKITRMPGGWVYSEQNAGSKSLCFIPYSEEFK